MTLLCALLPASPLRAETDPINEFLQHRIETLGQPGELEAAGQVLLATHLLQDLYQARAYATLWLQDRRPVRAALELDAGVLPSHDLSGSQSSLGGAAPPRLAARDQLPLIQRDPDYLDRMGFSVLRGWGAHEEQLDPGAVDSMAVTPRSFPFRLRQRPGPLNALGQLKFMFPNPHNVYLHATPARGDFASAERAVSSGCIRLSDPMALVDWLLLHRPGVATRSPEQIRSILESGQATTVRLSRPLPVYLLYWTAWIEDDRVVHTLATSTGATSPSSTPFWAGHQQFPHKYPPSSEAN